MKKVTKKKTTKKKITKSEDQPIRNLTELEMMQIDLNNVKVKEAESGLKHLRAERELKLIKLDNDLTKAASELNSLKGKRKTFIDKIKEDLGIVTETFSYDPLTGEVKL